MSVTKKPNKFWVTAIKVMCIIFLGMLCLPVAMVWGGVEWYITYFGKILGNVFK